MIERDLKQEIDTWSAKIAEKRATVVLVDLSRRNLLINIDAYISDSRHFYTTGDLIRSFEALIWAWSWIEILAELDIISFNASAARNLPTSVGR